MSGNVLPVPCSKVCLDGQGHSLPTAGNLMHSYEATVFCLSEDFVCCCINTLRSPCDQLRGILRVASC